MNVANEPAVTVALEIGGNIQIGSGRIAVADAIALVNAIERTASVQGFAEELGLSYRTAWERLRDLETALGHQLVQKTRGHGSVLTGIGVVLRDILATASASLAASLAREGRSIETRLKDVLGDGTPRLLIAASHDLLLMGALANWKDGEVSVMGSQEAVSQLIEGRVDAAGFHCGGLELDVAGSPFADLTACSSIQVRPLFVREQGLLVAAGNPLGITTLADLATCRARYVNRQKGSGTRLWFDRLLSEQGIPTSDIHGYGVEEFTHQAVAAVVAYGAADAGLGLRAAAERFNLDFVHVGWEVYYLATSASFPTRALSRFAAAVAVQAEQAVGYKPPLANHGQPVLSLA